VPVADLQKAFTNSWTMGARHPRGHKPSNYSPHERANDCLMAAGVLLCLDVIIPSANRELGCFKHQFHSNRTENTNNLTLDRWTEQRGQHGSEPDSDCVKNSAHWSLPNRRQLNSREASGTKVNGSVWPQGLGFPNPFRILSEYDMVEMSRRPRR
jgi:hypothetical protein